MIVVYAVTLSLPDDAAIDEADRRLSALDTELDPGTALLQRSVSEKKPDYRAAGLLHGGEPRLGGAIPIAGAAVGG